MCECEATSIRFTIDHYEPRSARPELVDDYGNLMYACDECNLRKGDRCPPPAARSAGFRFFRPDQDAHQDHFSVRGVRVYPKTPAGEFTIDAVDLNRQTLRRLRELRERATACSTYVAEGVAGLRQFEIDRLPRHIKGGAAYAINEVEKATRAVAQKIDDILRSYARSPLDGAEALDLSTDPERIARLKQLKILFPDSWRASHLTKTRGSPGGRSAGKQARSRSRKRR
jgi:hypothetical protein